MRRYLAALIEQSLWSLLNLGVNVALARFVAPETYGGFVFWANCGFVLSSLQNALTVCHLQVLTPGDAMEPHRLETERVMHATTAAFLVLVGVVVLGVTTLSPGASEFRTPAAAIFLPAYLFQQYLRSLTFSRGDAKGAAIQTGLVLLLATAFLGTAVTDAIKLDADGVMISLGLAYGIVGIGTAIRLCRKQMAGRPWPGLRDYLPYSRQSGWVFLGVTSAELLSRLYTFVVAATSGPGPLAAMAATQLFLRPLPLVAQAWAMGGRVDLLARRDSGDWAGFMRWVWIASLGGVVATIAWTPVLHFGWPLISEHVFAGKYRQFGWMVLIWGFATGFNFVQLVISAAIQALREFKALAIANASSSVAASIVIIVAAIRYGYGGVLVATALGLLFDVLVTGVLLVLLVRRKLRAVA